MIRFHALPKTLPPKHCFCPVCLKLMPLEQWRALAVPVQCGGQNESGHPCQFYTDKYTADRGQWIAS